MRETFASFVRKDLWVRTTQSLNNVHMNIFKASTEKNEKDVNESCFNQFIDI